MIQNHFQHFGNPTSQRYTRQLTMLVLTKVFGLDFLIQVLIAKILKNTLKYLLSLNALDVILFRKVLL